MSAIETEQLDMFTYIIDYVNSLDVLISKIAETNNDFFPLRMCGLCYTTLNI